jgi:hypothetical protein
MLVKLGPGDSAVLYSWRGLESIVSRGINGEVSGGERRSDRGGFPWWIV